MYVPLRMGRLSPWDLGNVSGTFSHKHIENKAIILWLLAIVRQTYGSPELKSAWGSAAFQKPSGCTYNKLWTLSLSVISHVDALAVFRIDGFLYEVLEVHWHSVFSYSSELQELFESNFHVVVLNYSFWGKGNNMQGLFYLRAEGKSDYFLWKFRSMKVCVNSVGMSKSKL